MQLPRRVPWTSLFELEQVCEWIYSPSSTAQDRQRAQHRLSAWATASILPSSLSSTLALLTALSLDTPTTTLPTLALRQTYTLSLIRLVNSLVDPLQGGMYARPIAHIARQLGIPAWWVELRHAGTHEDLPGLGVLREAAKEALDWLYTHYFLPTLHASTPLPPTYSSPLPLLKQYKSLSKSLAKDASLFHLRGEMDALLRAWERWVGEVRVALAGWWGEGQGDEGEGEGDRACMDVLADSLLAKGGLVPISRKKRPTLRNPTLLPSLAIWLPLLKSLQTHHPQFAPSLYSALLARISSSEDVSEGTTCLVWAKCMSLTGGNRGNELLRTLVRLLGEGEEKVERLLQVVAGQRVSAWEEGDVRIMEDRLERLQAAVEPSPVVETQEKGDAGGDVPPLVEEVRGWRLLEAQEWSARPIGWVA